MARGRRQLVLHSSPAFVPFGPSVVHTPGMHLTPAEHSLVKDGFGLSLGGLFWSRPYFPSRTERATLIRASLPPWALPTAMTAGWIWTGMGSPVPFDVLRPHSPALSPMERERWKARQHQPGTHTLAVVSALTLTDHETTIREILSRGRAVDACATQLLFLGVNPTTMGVTNLRLSRPQRERAGAMLERVRELLERYPDITRYTS